MGWSDFFWRRDAGAAADASPTFNGTRQDGRSRGVLETMSPHAPDPPLSEEIKRRQVALLLRYVTAIRAR